MLDLRQVREELRLGRVVVADRAHVSRFKLWEFESGKPVLTPEGTGIGQAGARSGAGAVRTPGKRV